VNDQSPFLSVLVPCYNEEATVAQALEALFAVDFPVPVDVVAVDDGSTDKTLSILEGFREERLSVVAHPRNSGKGAAIRSAARAARGEFVVMYDADLEYDAQDLARMVQVVAEGRSRVVFGTRSFGSHTAYSYWFV
jgi:dolichol-phosphate hexosyltransferase